MQQKVALVVKFHLAFSYSPFQEPFFLAKKHFTHYPFVGAAEKSENDWNNATRSAPSKTFSAVPKCVLLAKFQLSFGTANEVE